MIQKYLIIILLLPFSAIYGLVILIRNTLYSWGLLKSVTFNLPVIGVGNLSMGGAGKTPQVEYLIRLLQPYLYIGTLSRGYKRKTKGFRIVNKMENALTVGDEPFQYFLKFNKIVVAVSESRSLGIPLLLSNQPDLDIVLLDDSFQHRSVNPGLNILLTDYSNPYFSDLILPSGHLREWKSAADRADIVVVSKCPNTLSPEERSDYITQLDITNNQHLFFSKYRYRDPYELFTGVRRKLSGFLEIILLSAIANERYLLNYIEKVNARVTSIVFEDHHLFSEHDMSQLNQQFKAIPSVAKTIITTEKDATRLLIHTNFIKKEKLVIHILPVEVEFLFDQGNQFDTTIKQFLLNFKV